MFGWCVYILKSWLFFTHVHHLTCCSGEALPAWDILTPTSDDPLQLQFALSNSYEKFCASVLIRPTGETLCNFGDAAEWKRSIRSAARAFLRLRARGFEERMFDPGLLPGGQKHGSCWKQICMNISNSKVTERWRLNGIDVIKKKEKAVICVPEWCGICAKTNRVQRQDMALDIQHYPFHPKMSLKIWQISSYVLDVQSHNPTQNDPVFYLGIRSTQISGEYTGMCIPRNGLHLNPINLNG